MHIFGFDRMEFLSSVFTMVSVWLIWPVVIGIALYWYLTRNANYWSRQGIPQVGGIPFFGSIIDMFTKTFHENDLNNYRKHGRIFGAYVGRQAVLVVGQPDIIKNILVKDFPVFTESQSIDLGIPITDNMLFSLKGEHWKRVRMVITPTFSTGKIKRMISIFIDSAKTLTNNLNVAAKEGKHVDAKQIFGAFTMDVIASSAFATKIDSHNDPENAFVSAAKTVFRNPFPWRLALFLLCPRFMKFFRMNIFPPKVMDFFEKVTLKVIEERKRTKQRRNDFLQLMLDAVERQEKESDDVNESEEMKEMGHEENNEQVFREYQSSRTLSNIEMVANSIIFFLAGYDTTASTLSFTAYELAVNPHIQDRLIEEIDEAIKQKGGLNYEALCEMKYLDNVISETLRKYPAAISTLRTAEEDYEIKDSHTNINVIVPKRMLVAIPIYAIHHDPEHYPNPEKYDPDRFTHEQKSRRHPYAYLPFGAGPRNCVAMRFALMEIKVCLAAALSKFRFKTCPQTEIPVKFLKGGQGLLQPLSIWLEVEIRSDGNKL